MEHGLIDGTIVRAQPCAAGDSACRRRLILSITTNRLEEHGYGTKLPRGDDETIPSRINFEAGRLSQRVQECFT